MDGKLVCVRHRMVAAVMLSVLVLTPALASASEDREARMNGLFNQLTERLCQLQAALGNRLRMPIIDPAICTPVPPPPPEPTTGHLIVDKVTQPAGSARVFEVTAMGTGTIIGGGAGEVSDATNEEYEVTPGSYAVMETVPPGWMEVSNTCSEVMIAAGETKTCTITNAKLPMLTVIKEVINDNGGTATTSDFTLMIDGATTTSGVTMMTTAGAHTVSEGAHAGYTMTIGGDCAADGTITLAAGDTKTCTITNDDIAPEPEGTILISEIAWMGSMVDGEDESGAEWMELMNTGSADVDLSGWTVAATDGNPNISFSACENTVIPAGGFFLLVRAADSAHGVPADCMYPGGVGAASNQLENGGENLELRNAGGVLVDNVPAEVGGWVAGDNTTKDTMQRTSSETWATAAPTPGS